MARTLQLGHTKTKTKREGGKKIGAQKRQKWPWRDDEDNVVLTEKQPLQYKDCTMK